MQRAPYKAIDRYYNQTLEYNVPLPIFRRSVMPGQTANLDAVLDMKTAALPVSLNKLICTASYFYVPYSMIWDGWIDFITEGTGTFPLGPQLLKTFDKAATSVNSSMMRRAYKLVYNQYYGDEDSSTGLYDVTADTTVLLDKPVLTLEQRLRELLPASQFTADEYVAPVVGADATINHGDFSRSAATARRNFRFDKSGNKYVDYLKQFGAKPNFEVQIAPEHLGSVTRDIDPRTQAATDGANLGALSTYYSMKIPHSFRSKRFEEHGIVIGIAYCRPVSFDQALAASDLTMTARDKFFNGTNVNQEVNWTEFGGLSADLIVPPSFRYSAGQHVMNNNGQADMVLTNNSGSVNNRYAVNTISPDEATLGTDSLAYLNDVTWSGVSPASTQLVF